MILLPSIDALTSGNCVAPPWCADHKGQERQREAVARLECSLAACRAVSRFGHIHLMNSGHVRRGVLAERPCARRSSAASCSSVPRATRALPGIERARGGGRRNIHRLRNGRDCFEGRRRWRRRRRPGLGARAGAGGAERRGLRGLRRREIGIQILFRDPATSAGTATWLRSILFSRAILRTRGESGPAVSSTTVGASRRRPGSRCGGSRRASRRQLRRRSRCGRCRSGGLLEPLPQVPRVRPQPRRFGDSFRRPY